MSGDLDMKNISMYNRIRGCFAIDVIVSLSLETKMNRILSFLQLKLGDGKIL